MWTTYQALCYGAWVTYWASLTWWLAIGHKPWRM